MSIEGPSDKFVSWAQILHDLPGDWIGDSFALSFSGAIVAAGGNGKVRVFTHDPINNRWVQRGQDLNGKTTSDQFGKFLALSADGSTVAASAVYYDKDKSATNESDDDDYEGESTYTRNFRYDMATGRWNQLGQHLASTGGHQSLALSSDGTIVAAHGRVFCYDIATQEWTQLDQTLLDNPDYSIDSIALSSDGTIVAVAVSSYDDDQDCKGCHVQIFCHDKDRWSQLRQDLIGEIHDDPFGVSLAFLLDGTTVAVGANS